MHVWLPLAGWLRDGGDGDAGLARVVLASAVVVGSVLWALAQPLLALIIVGFIARRLEER